MRLRIYSAALPLLAFPIFASVPDTAGFDNLMSQGRAAFLAADPDRAEAAYQQACPTGLPDAVSTTRTVNCENLLASVDEVRGNLVRAEQRYLHAVAMAEQAGPAYRPLQCARLIDLGEYYRRQGKPAEAEAALKQAVDLGRELKQVLPHLLPQALTRLGGVYSQTANPDRGRAPLTEALAIMTAPGPFQITPPLTEMAYARNCLGMIEMAAGRDRDAEAALREAVSLATRALGEDHPVVATYQTNLALALIAERQFGRASLLLRRAEFVMQEGHAAPGSELALICTELSTSASGEGKLTQAEEYAQRAVEILSSMPQADASAVAVAQVTLGGVYLKESATRKEAIAQAEKILPRAVQTQRDLAFRPRTLAASLQLLAELRVRQRDWPAAETLYREAIRIQESGELVSAPLLHGLADVLKHKGGSKEEVRALESRARDLARGTDQS